VNIPLAIGPVELSRVVKDTFSVVLPVSIPGSHPRRFYTTFDTSVDHCLGT